MKDSKQHYLLLDGLRGVAALMVVIYHICEGYAFAGGQPVITGVNHGYLAVDFFFILSGFVIGYAYDDRWGKTLSAGGFAKRRLVRLHPMVVMGAVIGTVAFALQGFTNWNGERIATETVLIAMLCGMIMLPALPGMGREVRGNGEMFPLNGPCWSLFFEYIGNILYALLLRRLPTRVLGWLTAALGVAWAWFAITDAAGYGCMGVGWTIDAMNLFGGLLRLLFPFTMGMWLSRTFRPQQIKGAFWLCALCLILLFLVPYIDGGGTISLNGVFEAFCVAVCFPLLVWIGASGEAEGKVGGRICRFLGDISYPLYAVHYPAMYVFFGWLMKTGRFTFAETWPVAIATVAVSVAVAWLCLEYYDKLVRKWLGKKLG